MSGKIIKDPSALGQFGSAIAQICEEKGIDKERVIDSVEAALAAAYKKDYGKKGQIILAKLDEKNGEASFKQLKEVVDENMRTIDWEYLPDEARQIPGGSKKSEEKVERFKSVDMEDEDGSLPRFNPERDVLIEDAKKVDKGLKLGDFIEFELETKDQYGRVASQTAKQVIIQKIREAERDTMYQEYKGKEGEVVNGNVQRIEGGRIYIDMGKAIGVLYPSEQIPSEKYNIGQRIRVYIDKVESDSKGPGIVLSRKHPNLLYKLFELEVPEIFSGAVEIKSIAREAGSRSKVAVVSNEEGIDPIGSCVGQKGTRVQAIIDEVNGEKIDIIEWNEDAEELIASALAPAKVIKVELLEEEGKARAYVTSDQLSLAIGKSGQNVRLASRLTGWSVDVQPIENDEKKEEKTDSEPKKEVEEDVSVDEKKEVAAEEVVEAEEASGADAEKVEKKAKKKAKKKE